MKYFIIQKNLNFVSVVLAAAGEREGGGREGRSRKGGRREGEQKLKIVICEDLSHLEYGNLLPLFWRSLLPSSSG